MPLLRWGFQPQLTRRASELVFCWLVLPCRTGSKWHGWAGFGRLLFFPPFPLNCLLQYMDTNNFLPSECRFSNRNSFSYKFCYLQTLQFMRPPSPLTWDNWSPCALSRFGWLSSGARLTIAPFVDRSSELRETAPPWLVVLLSTTRENGRQNFQPPERKASFAFDRRKHRTCPATSDVAHSISFHLIVNWGESRTAYIDDLSSPPVDQLHTFYVSENKPPPEGHFKVKGGDKRWATSSL